MSSRRIRESRRSRRMPKRQGAWIGLQGGRIPCVIWDQSAEGARLAAPRSKKLPDTFTLLLSRDGKSRRFCRVAWRSDTQVGIQFIEALDEDDIDFEAPQPARYPLSAKPAADKPELAGWRAEPARAGVAPRPHSGPARRRAHPGRRAEPFHIHQAANHRIRPRSRAGHRRVRPRSPSCSPSSRPCSMSPAPTAAAIWLGPARFAIAHTNSVPTRR